MIRYINFSLDNVFLLDGYSEEDTPDGTLREYEDEEGLEHALRCIVATKKRFLSGWDLRFLRQGLGLSQAQLGELFERDAQTVARWEKSKDNIPILVDIAIRVQFCSIYSPEFSVKELSALVGGATSLPDNFYFSRINGKWNVAETPRSNIRSVSSADSVGEILISEFPWNLTSTVAANRFMVTRGDALFMADTDYSVDPILARALETFSAAPSKKVGTGKSAYSFTVDDVTGRA